MPLKAWLTTWRATCSASTTISAGCSLRPERRRLPVLGQLLLEVAVLGAGEQADFPQGREVLLGLGEVPDHQVGLAQIFVRAAMARIELQRARIVLEGERHLAEVAVRVAQVVLDVRVARVAQRRRRKQPHRTLPVLLLDRLPAARVLGVAGILL